MPPADWPVGISTAVSPLGLELYKRLELSKLGTKPVRSVFPKSLVQFSPGTLDLFSIDNVL